MLNGGIYLCPQVSSYAVDFESVVVFSVCVDSSKLEEVASTDSAETGVGSFILTGSHSLHFSSLRQKHFALFQSLIVVGHSSTDVDDALVAQY